MDGDLAVLIVLCVVLCLFGIRLVLVGSERVKLPEKQMRQDERTRWLGRLRRTGWTAIAVAITLVVVFALSVATGFI